MKKLFLIPLLFVFTLSVSVAQTFDTAKAHATANEVLGSASTVAGALDNATENIDFGNATELKDSVLAVIEAAPNDPKAQEIKNQAIELINLGVEAKKNPHAIAPLIVTIIGFLALVIGYLVSHFGFLKKKKQPTT